MSEQSALLFANDAFYAAFATRDLEAMDGLWADSPTVTCLHPGWNPLFGRDKVMASWRAILAGDMSPAVTCRDARALVMGDAGYVICYEELPQGFLAATNIFVREGSVWRMVHHQSGPTPTPALRSDAGDPPSPPIQ